MATMFVYMCRPRSPGFRGRNIPRGYYDSSKNKTKVVA